MDMKVLQEKEVLVLRPEVVGALFLLLVDPYLHDMLLTFLAGILMLQFDLDLVFGLEDLDNLSQFLYEFRSRFDSEHIMLGGLGRTTRLLRSHRG